MLSYAEASGFLVVCTRNRAAQLEQCLEHIARLRPTCSWELVVVLDNASSDRTCAGRARFATEVIFPVTIIFEGKPSLGRARNTGWSAARGDIVAMTDDDCYVLPDYIDRVREIFDDPKIGFAGGRVDLFDPTDYPISIVTSDEPALKPPRSFIQPGWIIGANMIFRREVLEAIEGFDPDLGPGTPFCADDPDGQARASFAGWWGLYTPDVVVAHHHRRKAKDADALTRTYLIGGGAYMAKFLLNSETRSTYLRIGLREWYWTFRRDFLRKGHGLSYLWWEAYGAVAYLAYRIRKRTFSDRSA